MSIVAQVITNSDRSARYPNSSELDSLGSYFQTRKQRLKTAKILQDNEQQIVQQGSQKFWKKYPNTPSLTRGETAKKMYLRDMGWYLRLISYCVLAGNEQPLHEIGIVGIKEMYNALDVPLSLVAEAIRSQKEASLQLMSADEAAVVGPYFDYIVRSVS